MIFMERCCVFLKDKILKIARHTVPFLTAVFVFWACFAFPASAAGLDYNDYVSNVMVDGDNDIVSVSFPTSYAGWTAYENLTDLVGQGDGAVQWFSFSTYNQWQIICNFPSATIDLSNIPNGTKVGFGVDLVIQRTSRMPFSQNYEEEISIIYKLKDGTTSVQSLGSVTKTMSASDIFCYINLTSTGVPLQIPDNADSMYLELKVRSHTGAAEYWACKCNAQYFDMEMNISSLYRQQQLTGKTNKLLDEVNRQLEEQGKTMNDILNGTPEQNDQVGGVVGDMEDSIDDFQNSMDQMADATLPPIEFDDYVPFELTGNEFLHFSTVLGSFWSNTVLARFMSILGGIILISFILFGEKH